MAYNRKMRKFEGTCYIPGEQLAMMAKYYRGANLNLNLTLYEDDLATMQETLDQACWCSKLDEIDRMKMAHMKGNEWRIAHDHCMEGNQHGHDGRSHQIHPALPQRSRSTVGKVERGTSTLSLYDRERGLVRGGRYERETYSEPRCRRYDYYDYQHRRGDYYDHRNRRDEYYDRNRADDFYDPRNRGNDYNNPRDGFSEPNHRRDDYYYDLQNLKDEYNDRRFRKTYYSDPRSVREDDDMHYRSDDYSGQPTYHAQHALVDHSERRSGRFMGTSPDRRHEMESEAAMSSLPEVPEIRCAVCNLETCLVCKNHLYTPMCQCKCPMANAGLCNKCRQEPCEEEEDEHVAQETRGKKIDMTSMILTMMMSSMLKQSQSPESVCCCKPSRGESETSSSDLSDEKIHTVYLYDCQGSKNGMANGCCKCSTKSKKNSEKRNKVKTDSSGEGTNESDSSHKNQSSKKKGSEDSKKKPKEGDSDSGSDHKPKGGHGRNMKPASEKRKSNKDSKEQNSKADKFKDGKLKFSEADERNEYLETNKGISGRPRAQENAVNTSMKSRSAGNSSVTKSQGVNTSDTDRSKVTWKEERSPQKSLSRTGVQLPENHDTQNNVKDFKPTHRDGDMDGFRDESSTTVGMREFIVCLPKIQSNLQSLMYKLNQMDVLNNQLKCPQSDPSLTNTKLFSSEMQTHHDVSLTSSPQNPMHNSTRSLFTEHTGHYNNKYLKPDPRNSRSYQPSTAPVQNLPSTISLGSSMDEPKVHEPSNPTRYHSVVNFSSLGGGLETSKQPAFRKKQVHNVHDLIAEPTQSIKSTFKCSPLVGGTKEKDIIVAPSGNQWTFQKGYHAGPSPSLIIRDIDQLYRNTEPGKIHLYGQGNSSDGDDLQPQPKVVSPIGSHNFEITELPDTAICNQGTTPSRKFAQVHYAGTGATTVSPFEGETIFQSYIHESSATLNQDLTDYASFTDENCFKPPPETSSQQFTYNKRKEINGEVHKSSTEAKQLQKQNGQDHNLTISEFPRSQTEKHISHIKRSALKVHKGVAFKAKQRSPLSLGKLVQGCTLRGGTANNFNLKKATVVRPRRKQHNKGVGPGKFRRSKFDSSLDPLKENVLKKNEFKYPNLPQALKASVRKTTTYMVTPKIAGVNHEVIPSKNKCSGPIKEKAKHTLSMNENKLSPKINMSTMNSKVGIQNPPDFKSEQIDPSVKLPDENAKLEMGSQSCIASSDELRSIENACSSTSILKIASSSPMNLTNNISLAIPQSRPVRTGNFENVTLIPPPTISAASGPESGIENQSESNVEKPAFIDNVSSSTTPNVLKKSRVQVEQLKRAHETIRSMIKNVNAVIAHIDSDSKIGIKSKVRREDKDRRSYIVRVGDDDKKRQNHIDYQERNDATHFEEDVALPGTSSLPSQSSDVQNLEVQEMFLSVNRVLNSVMTPSSERSSETQQPDWRTETSVPTKAHRDFFVLSSESSANAFIETLRRSLENESSSSSPLATQRTQISERVDSPRQRMTRPLKRRSWFPSPKQ